MSIEKATGLDLKKICIWLLAVYIAVIVGFYFFCGEQLHFRESKGNLTMHDAESGTTEMVSQATVTQDFSVRIQRLMSISVKWGTYYRANSGVVLMELFDLRDHSLILSQAFDVSDISEGGITTMTASAPIETVYNVPLRLLITADSQPGSAVSPLMSSSAQDEGFALSVNGVPAEGTLCFSATGEDYIWTGLHYWECAAVFGAILAGILFFMVYRVRRGKTSRIFNALVAMKRYRFLINQLVSRDFKTKYKRSVLGVLWSFLNPLLTMLVQYMVFSNLFRFDVPYFIVYLLCGVTLFNFFSESCSMSLASITGNASLITKVYVPKYIYPLTRTLSSLTNLLLSLIPLLIVTLLSGLSFTKAMFLLPIPLLCLAIFALGMGMLLSSAMVFFRDTQFLWGVLSVAWSYATPLFYPASILPENIRWLLDVNPIYYYVTMTRTLLIDGISPEPRMYFAGIAFALGMLAVGAFVFKKTQDRFVLHL